EEGDLGRAVGEGDRDDALGGVAPVEAVQVAPDLARHPLLPGQRHEPGRRLPEGHPARRRAGRERVEAEAREGLGLRGEGEEGLARDGPRLELARRWTEGGELAAAAVDVLGGEVLRGAEEAGQGRGLREVPGPEAE